MDKIEQLKYELSVREAYARGEMIEIKNERNDHWYQHLDVAFIKQPFHEYYRIHDPYREFKEAEKEGKTIQMIDPDQPGDDWRDLDHSSNWCDSPDAYRIKPDEPKPIKIVDAYSGYLKTTHRAPTTAAEKLSLIKTILYSPLECRSILKGVQAIVEEE